MGVDKKMSKWLASRIFHESPYILKIDETHYKKCGECSQDYISLHKEMTEDGDERYEEAICNSRKEAIQFMLDGDEWLCNGCGYFFTEMGIDKKEHDCESLIKKPRNTKKHRIQRKNDIESKIKQLKSELRGLEE